MSERNCLELEKCSLFVSRGLNDSTLKLRTITTIVISKGSTRPLRTLYAQVICMQYVRPLTAR